MVIDFRHPAQIRHEVRDLLLGKVLLGHFPERSGKDNLGFLQSSADCILSKLGIGTSKIGGIVGAESDDRVTVVAVVTLKGTFPGYYLTSDAGYRDEDGYLWIMSRIDDIINVAGHRLSTGAIEEVVAAHPSVAECAVIGVADELKGQIPVGFVVLKAGADRSHPVIAEELVRSVRDTIGPVAAFKTVYVVPRLPKTRSGKILRSTMRKIADGQPWTTPATIDDPAILDEIGVALGK